MRETILLRIDGSAFSGFSAYFAGIPPKTAKAPIYGEYSPLMQEKNDAAEAAERIRIMENAKATEAQKLQKYNLAAEIKRKYEELQRVKKASDESVEKIRANRNYSREYIGKCVEGIRSKQKEEQRRIYNSASEKIRRLEQAIAAERPSEAFDFGSQKFTNALKLIETGGKNLPEDVQRMIAAQFRYCPDALNVLSPLMSAAGMQYGNEAINQLYNETLTEKNYPNSLEDAFFFECESTNSYGMGLENCLSQIDGYVRSSDVFNAEPGVADEPTDEEKADAAMTEMKYIAQLRAGEIVAQRLADARA